MRKFDYYDCSPDPDKLWPDEQEEDICDEEDEGDEEDDDEDDDEDDEVYSQKSNKKMLLFGQDSDIDQEIRNGINRMRYIDDEDNW